jgi:hypothetical protein
VEQVANPEQHLDRVEWLRDEVVRPHGERPLLRGLGRVSGQDQHRGGSEPVVLLEQSQDLEAVGRRHVQVQQHEVVGVLPAQRDRALGIAHAGHGRVAVAREHPLEQDDVALLVVDHEDPVRAELGGAHAPPATRSPNCSSTVASRTRTSTGLAR